MIVVHQMAKVASQSWVQATKPAAAAEGGRPYHCHFMVPANRRRIEAAYAVPKTQQTIANMLLPLDITRAGAIAWDAVTAARQHGERVRVIAGIRDPVARSISALVFMADFYGHVSRPLNPRAALSVDDAVDMLQGSWRAVLDRREPDSTFEWLLWYLTGAFRDWFSEEFTAAYGVDLLAEPLRPWTGARRIDADGTQILLYRAEDLMPSAPGHTALLIAASAFLELPLASFPAVNNSAGRRSRTFSRDLQNQFRLPRVMLEAIYGEPIVRRFYSDGEITAMTRRWQATPASPGGG